MTTNRVRRLRMKLWKKQNGLCYFCREPMILVDNFGAQITEETKRFATLEHLRDSFHPSGRSNKESTLACSCLECNITRNLALQQQAKQARQAQR